MLFLISAIDTSIYSEDLEPSRYLLYRWSNEWYHYLFNSSQCGKPLCRCAFAFREFIIMLLSKQSKQKSRKNVKGMWSQNSCDNLHHHHCHHIWAMILPQTKARLWWPLHGTQSHVSVRQLKWKRPEVARPAPGSIRLLLKPW